VKGMRRKKQRAGGQVSKEQRARPNGLEQRAESGIAIERSRYQVAARKENERDN